MSFTTQLLVFAYLIMLFFIGTALFSVEIYYQAKQKSIRKKIVALCISGFIMLFSICPMLYLLLYPSMSQAFPTLTPSGFVMLVCVLSLLMIYLLNISIYEFFRNKILFLKKEKKFYYYGLILSIVFILIAIYCFIVYEKRGHAFSEFTNVQIEDAQLSVLRKDTSIGMSVLLPPDYYLGTQYEREGDVVYLKDYGTLESRSLTNSEKKEGNWGEEQPLSDKILNASYKVVFKGDFKGVKYIYHKDKLIWSKNQSKCGNQEVQTRCVEGLPK